MELNRKQKIDLLESIQSGLIKPEEVGKGCIRFKKLPDGTFRREAGGKIYSKEELGLFKSEIPSIKMVLELEDTVDFCFFTFLQLMQDATANE